MNSFLRDNRYIIGANYWASHASINMWSDWRADIVELDFQILASHGIKTLRIFPLWPVFQPIKAIYANEIIYEYRMMPGEQPLPDTEAGRAGVSEEACEHFEELCRIADKYGIKLIVALLTGHMSFRFYSPEAFEGKNFLSDPTVIKWEVRFVRYFVKRFKAEKAIIAWDLGNECNCMRNGIAADQGYVWNHCITSAIRESDSTRPVISGFDSVQLDGGNFNVREHAELVDILTTHPYQIFSNTSIDPINSMRPEIDPSVRATLYETLGGKPAFVEEIGSIGYVNNSEETEADFLRTVLFSTWAEGNRGLLWWCAFDQGKFDYAPYDWNNYGSDYGLFRADYSPKPVAKVMKEFDSFLRSFEYADLPRHTVEAVCIVPRQLQNPLKTLGTTFILAKQANLNISFVHAEEKLPDSQLYIMPSVFSGKPIFLHRLNDLLDKVREGASFYFSLGDTLFRRIPELTGLVISSRERGGNETVTFNGDKFNLGGNYRYNIESIAESCEVLAIGGDERPVFVRNRYGKGYIYFLTFPLEAMIADKAGIFKNENCDPYYKFYCTISEKISSGRAVESKNLCVLTTEHIIDENKRIAVAVNYANKPMLTEIKCFNGWVIGKLHRGAYSEDKILIPANDAAILELIR